MIIRRFFALQIPQRFCPLHFRRSLLWMKSEWSVCKAPAEYKGNWKFMYPETPQANLCPDGRSPLFYTNITLPGERRRRRRGNYPQCHVGTSLLLLLSSCESSLIFGSPCIGCKVLISLPQLSSVHWSSEPLLKVYVRDQDITLPL